MYTVIGFLFMSKRRHFTDPSEYGDWVGQCFVKYEMRERLHFGQLPEGLILNGPGGPVVVKGQFGQHHQRLVALSEMTREFEKSMDTDQVRRIVEHLAEIRKDMGLTQRELSQRLGLSQMTISHIECGYIRNMRPSTEEKLMQLGEIASFLAMT